MSTINNIFLILKKFNKKINKDLILKAFNFAEKIHYKQLRKNGDLYFMHPLAVSTILSQMFLDENTIVSGLLHDAIEDTSIELNNIYNIFGPTITNLVDGVTKLSDIKFTVYKERQAENFKKMLFAMSKDIRIILIKLADRLHNMRTLKFVSHIKQILISKETLDIYCPLANKLGIYWLKSELEDLSFKYFNSIEYKKLQYRIGQRKSDRIILIKIVASIMTKILRQLKLVNFRVLGRPKYLWSIYQKIINKGVNFGIIYDLIAFRIILKNIDDCYRTLGLLHSIWRPIMRKFKDYIFSPKSNGYQSLHTTVIGPFGYQIEFQIKTYEMHTISESGVAAHWNYKKIYKQNNLNSIYSLLFKGFDTQNFIWLKQLINWPNKFKNYNNFINCIKDVLFSDIIYVITPQGQILSLQNASTSVDFAYVIHSYLGMHYIGTRINGKIKPIYNILRSGDRCEVIVHYAQTPKKYWLLLAKTSRAKNYISLFLKKNEYFCRRKLFSISKFIIRRFYTRKILYILKIYNFYFALFRNVQLFLKRLNNLF